MNLKDYRQTFYEFTGKASDLNRQLAFAAIALIWLFKTGADSQPTFPHKLILPGGLVVVSLFLDMLQYCVGAIVWRMIYTKNEAIEVSETEDLDHSVWSERPIWFLFIVKILFVMTAYVFIFLFFLDKLSGASVSGSR